ncbi:MAG: electron transfer flavoprotein subunit alpha/FixB family protein [Microscillaceae bacterium]|nr:electron transfer flavoprotein subunit alpha/FixB family protein [Microscillaceae bacterium]MDW8459648.1 electron transfer flavoprotein subunit alpha/FixB family protein [Cytophagales bacterium]
MSVLIFVETANGGIRKTSLEAIGYGAEVAKIYNTTTTALVLGTEVPQNELEKLGNYGANKVWQVADERLNHGVIQAYSQAIAQAAQADGATILIFAKSSLADAVASRVAIKLKAGLASNATELPTIDGNTLKVKRSVYTGKAFEIIAIHSENKIITIKKNAYSPTPTQTLAKVEQFTATLSDSDFSVKLKEVQKVTGEVLLPEADIVVAGGRGLKGPENWGIILDLAKTLGAATGCSKPVSDLNWRPHHEHVGQTGIKVSPNLYIAVGISGAIQHLAGVSSSKCIVVINKDADAPFFKAADYGIVGDAFEVLPKLTKAFAQAMN